MSKINELFGKLKIKRDNNLADDDVKPSTSSTSNGIILKKTNSNCSETSENNAVQSYCLARNLDEVIDESTSLSYYINFLESIDCLNVIKFWLHVEGFKSSYNDENSARTDAENIFNNYLKSDAPLAINISERMKNIIYARIFNSTHDGITAKCFEDAQKFVWSLMIDRYFKKFLLSSFYAKYQLEVYQSRQLSLQDILRSHQLLSSFIEFLEDNHRRNFLEFVIAVDSFVVELEEDEHSSLGRKSELQDDAMLIYDRFISMQATDPLGFQDDVRIAVESGICTEGGKPRKDAFSAARHVALTTLQEELIPPFLSSTNFAKIVDELRSSIENNVDTMTSFSTRMNNAAKHRLSNGSLQSTSTHPAANESEWRRKSSHFRNRSQTCDNDGDSCWGDDFVAGNDGKNELDNKTQRKQICSSLAKIDQFGRYIPLFDNTLINNDEFVALSARNRLRNTLDKYLNQTAAKESLVADEMAELIIGEIQNMVSVANPPPR